MSSAAGSSPPAEPATARLERRLARERAARLEAEAIAERVTRDLYASVREARRAHALTELLGSIAVAANEADSEERALQVALNRICAHMGWPIGHALAVSAAGDLVSTGLWHLTDIEGSDGFRALSESLQFPSGVGLPGRVLETGAPASIVDVTDDRNFPRSAAAAAAGLRSALAFPVLVRSDVHAVLEFFAHDRVDVDDQLLRVMGQIGTQLGRVRERQLAESRLTELAMQDPLTGLGNRTLLLAHADKALARADRLGTPVSVLFLDLDDFKSINDSLGHEAGDAVLCEVARRIEATLRDADVVARAAVSTAARFGGDEFAVLLEGCADPGAVAERIAESLRPPLHVSGQEIFVTASAGGTVADPASDAADALRAANVAMHAAKQSGKRRYQRFEPTMYDAAIRRHRLAGALRRAITGGELRLHYQPQVDVTTGRTDAVEALVRWQHPELGLVPPQDFIGLAEDTGLIVDLGRWVLEAACAQAVAWAHAHPDLAELTMAVNVSARQLRDADFPSTVAEVLASTGLDPGKLCLEVTETALVEQLPVVDGVLDGLCALGVRLAIDDFGTGYSSLSTLKRLPVDVLKIDRSFVAQIPNDEDAGTIVWTITSLGHRLGLRVVAEGIETEAQLDALGTFGCDIAQGFHFARPAPADDILTLLLAGAPAPAPA